MTRMSCTLSGQSSGTTVLGVGLAQIVVNLLTFQTSGQQIGGGGGIQNVTLATRSVSLGCAIPLRHFKSMKTGPKI